MRIQNAVIVINRERRATTRFICEMAKEWSQVLSSDKCVDYGNAIGCVQKIRLMNKLLRKVSIKPKRAHTTMRRRPCSLESQALGLFNSVLSTGASIVTSEP